MSAGDIVDAAGEGSPIKRVAVTGATGFVGRRLVANLRRRGWGVRALVRRPAPELMAAGAELAAGDLDDAASLEALVAGMPAVVHCGGLVQAVRSSEFMRVNVGGTANLAAAVRHREGPTRFILVSSLAAREPQLSSYGASKSGAEVVANKLAGDAIEVGVIRPPAVYGPGDRGTLPIFQQLERGFLLVPANQDARFSLIFVDDLADLIADLLEVPSWPEHVIEPDDGHLGGYDWDTLRAIGAAQRRRRIRMVRVPRGVMMALGGLCQVGAQVRGRPLPLSPGKVRELFHPDWVVDPKAGWSPADAQPSVTFETGYARTREWYKQHDWL